MSNALIPYQEMQNMALAVVKGRLFPEIDTPEKAITLMLLCQAEGLHPMTALRRYHLIQGRPAMKADAMLAEFYRRGGTVEWHEVSDTKCDATFTSSGAPKGLRVTWTLEDAQRAGLAAKAVWRQYPRAMLRARTASEGIRATDPAVNGGIYTEEEVRDMATDPAPVPVGEPVAAEARVVEVAPALPEPPSNGLAMASPIPEKCSTCGADVEGYFSESKRYKGRRYFQCSAAYAEKELLKGSGTSNAKANAAVDAHFRAWAEAWPSDTAQPEAPAPAERPVRATPGPLPEKTEWLEARKAKIVAEVAASGKSFGEQMSIVTERLIEASSEYDRLALEGVTR